MKKLLPFLALIFLSALAAGQVSYSAEVDKNRMAVNASILLECDEEEAQCPVNSWNLDWSVPKEAEILAVNYSGGEADYSRKGKNLQIDTGSGPRKSLEKIRIHYRIEEPAERLQDNFYRREISFPGLPDQKTFGEIKVENLLSTSFSGDLRASHGDNSVNFTGEGGGAAIINMGEGETTDGYTFIQGDVENASLAYRVAVATVGFRNDYPSIPVVVLPEEFYEQRASPWSQGEFTQGVIWMRESDERLLTPVLAHETVHAFNRDQLERSEGKWLDEGIASYVESLVRKRMEETRIRNVFWENKSRREMRGGSLYLVEEPSQGKKERLWDYYKEENDFMKEWKPSKGNRTFGYAYSELVIRKHVSSNNSIPQIYSYTGEEFDNPEERWNHYDRYMDLTPCKHDSEGKFEACLEEVNNFDYPVYYAEKLPESTGVIKVQELEEPEYSEVGSPDFMNRDLYSKGVVNQLIALIQSIFQEIPL